MSGLFIGLLLSCRQFLWFHFRTRNWVAYQPFPACQIAAVKDGNKTFGAVGFRQIFVDGLTLVSSIRIRKHRADFRQDTIFVLDIEAETKQPGTLTGEQCPVSDIVNNSYDYLSTQYPHWRRLLSDEYMRNTKLNDVPLNKKLKGEPKTSAQLVLLHIDDHAWASIVHYLTACKFSTQPDIYNSFCLDSGNPTSQWTAAQIKHHATMKLHLSKEAEKDWYDNKKIETWRRALLAKFAQNEDLKRALILTGWAKLVDKHLFLLAIRLHIN